MKLNAKLLSLKEKFHNVEATSIYKISENFNISREEGKK